MLALAEVQDWHDSGLFVLRRITLKDLGNDRLVLRRKLERDRGVVVGRVAVLETGRCLVGLGLGLGGQDTRTTERVSLHLRAEMDICS